MSLIACVQSHSDLHCIKSKIARTLAKVGEQLTKKQQFKTVTSTDFCSGSVCFNYNKINVQLPYNLLYQNVCTTTCFTLNISLGPG